MVWAYLGPLPAPLLPRWDLLVEPDLDREVNVYPLPCNWLQCMDNSVDPVHFELSARRLRQLRAREKGQTAGDVPGQARQDRLRRLQATAS